MAKPTRSDEIRKRDLQVFAAESASIQRLAATVGIGVLIIGGVLAKSDQVGNLAIWIPGIMLVLAVHAYLSWHASVAHRFYSQHMKALWEGCMDRLNRFHEVKAKAKDTSVADLNEMPRTIDTVAESVYRALRKADIIAHEVAHSESGLSPLPPASQQPSDAQSRELFQVADRNIAEYRLGMAAVMAGVQRSEAQAAVFMTTLDTLRMKMLGYRLVGRSPEMPSHEFLAAIAEAKLQLESIDKALDELDLSIYPKMVAAVRTSSPTKAPDETQSVEGRG